MAYISAYLYYRKALSRGMEVLKLYKQKEKVKGCKKCKGKRASGILVDATVGLKS